MQLRPGNWDDSTVEWTYTRETDGDLKVEEKQKCGTAYTGRTVTNTYNRHRRAQMRRRQRPGLIGVQEGGAPG